MTTLKFADTHNMVAFLAKPAESEGFKQIVDFLNAHTIKYELTINPTIYTSCIEQLWATVKAKTVNGEVQIQALVGGKKIIITESNVRRDLQLEDDEGVDCLPNATIFEQLTLIGSKTTVWNEFSSTMASAIICLATNQKFNFSKYIFENETVNEEMEDSLEMAATTATSLDAEQDSGNIDKIQSKATLNEPSSSGTSSGSCPMRQETMGDIIAQTRSTNVSKLSNDPLLARVLALETTKPTQATEIASLKRRVKKLERRNKSRTHGLKRLYKIDEDMFGVNDLDGDEVIVESVDVVNTAEETRSVIEEVTAVTIPASAATTTTTTTVITDVEITLAQALAELKSEKPKADKEQAPTLTVSSQQPSHVKVQDKGKRKMVEPEPVKKVSKKELLMLDEKLAFKLQAEEEEEERLAREKAQQVEEANIAWDDVQAKIDADYHLAQRLQAQEQDELTDEKNARLFVHSFRAKKKKFSQTELVEESSKKVEPEIAHKSSLKRAGEELEQESSKKQKLEEDKESEELKQCLEIIPDDGDDVTIDATPLSTKSPTIVDYKIYKEGKKSYFQIIRADGNSQMYLTFGKMLKNFDREDLEVLWSIVKARFKKTEPVNYMDNFLLLNLKTMFEHHVEDNNMLFYLLVEKMYPLTNHTLHQMFNDVKLQVDYECEMAFELLRLVKKQLKEGYGRIVGIKRLHDDLEVTAAKLMLLVYKLLLLVLEVNVASTKVTTAQRLRLLKEFLLSRDG
ncbi:hypothetical protein Tco_0272704 [Tanacetum coccineum]